NYGMEAGISSADIVEGKQVEHGGYYLACASFIIAVAAGFYGADNSFNTHNNRGEIGNGAGQLKGIYFVICFIDMGFKSACGWRSRSAARPCKSERAQ